MDKIDKIVVAISMLGFVFGIFTDKVTIALPFMLAIILMRINDLEK